MHRGLSAGRVQSVALKMVCDREKEIKDFKQEEYWSITADLKGSKNPEFQAKLFKIGKDKAEVGKEDQAQEIVKAVEKWRMAFKRSNQKRAETQSGGAVHHQYSATGGFTQAQFFSQENHDAGPAFV